MAAKAENPKRERKEKPLEAKPYSNTVTFDLFKEGKSIPQIAEERKLSVATIESHLCIYISDGIIDINHFVSTEKQALIKEAIKIHGTSGTRNLKDNLPEDITYGDIKMVMAAEKLDVRK